MSRTWKFILLLVRAFKYFLIYSRWYFWKLTIKKLSLSKLKYPVQNTKLIYETVLNCHKYLWQWMSRRRYFKINRNTILNLYQYDDMKALVSFEPYYIVESFIDGQEQYIPWREHSEWTIEVCNMETHIHWFLSKFINCEKNLENIPKIRVLDIIPWIYDEKLCRFFGNKYFDRILNHLLDEISKIFVNWIGSNGIV